MKAEQIIGNYCRLYGVTMPELRLSGNDYFVTIKPSGADVMRNQRTKLLGQIIGFAMRSGVVLHVQNGWVKPLEWDKWKEFWKRNFAPIPKANCKLKNPSYERMLQRTMFEEGKGERSPKKGKSGGNETTFRENMNLHRMGTPIPSARLA